jgi:hypothetical protein
MTFTRILLNVLQDKFEAMPTHNEEPGREEIDEDTLKRQINLCSLLGHLVVRKLLAAQGMAQVAHGLIGMLDGQPEKCVTSCLSVLLNIFGRTLDMSGQGDMLMEQLVARFSNLAGWPHTRVTCHEVCARLSQMQLDAELSARPHVAATHAWVRHAIDGRLIMRIALADYPRVLDLKLMLARRFGRDSIRISFVDPTTGASSDVAQDLWPTSWLLPIDGSDDTIRVEGLRDFVSPQLPGGVCQHIQAMLPDSEQLECDLEDSTKETIESMAEEPEIDMCHSEA